MGRMKHVLMSLLVAVVVSAIQFWVAMRYSMDLLWQVRFMHYLAGPGPILGYRNGKPLYEGTPVHIMAAFVGLVLGAVLYWVIGYFVIKKWHNRQLELNED